MIVEFIIYAFIWPTNSQEMKINFSSKCKENLKTLFESKMDPKLKKFELIPEISCLVCSKPDSSSKTSTIKELPLYTNILEFGFPKNFIPKETVATIKIKNICSFKLIITAITDPIVYEVKFMECPNNDCSTELYKHRIELSSSERCLHVGLIFFEGKKVYYSISKHCRFVSIVYFDKKKAVAITSDECRFSSNIDKANASLEFSVGTDFNMDSVPVVLPCSAGGYAFDYDTGMLYEGSSCARNFLDPNFNIPNSGLNFVISLVYQNNDSFVFRKKTYQSTNYPIYLFENGSAAPREEMTPNIKEDPWAENKTRINCSFVNVAEIGRRCNEEKFALEHERIWNEKPNYSKYVPKYSCLLCAKPVCNFSSPSCQKWVSTEYIPVYNNLLEFGLYGRNFPNSSDIKVVVSEQCYLKIEISPENENKDVSVCISECLFYSNDCRVISYTVRQNFLFPIECLFLALGFVEYRKIYYADSTSCTSLPSTKFYEKGFLTLTKASCHFNTTGHPFIVQYKFLQDGKRLKDGVPVILPCSPGGYVVDPLTGRFLNDEKCETLYFRLKPETDSPINFIIYEFYDNNEEVVFPTPKVNITTNRTRKLVIPIYIDEKLQGKPIEEMKPKPKRWIDLKPRYRIGCYYNEVLPESLSQSQPQSQSKSKPRVESKYNKDILMENNAVSLSIQFGFELRVQQILKNIVFTSVLRLNTLFEVLLY